MKFLRWLFVALVFTVLGFIAGFQYHGKLGDNVRDALAMGAISSLKINTVSIASCESKRRPCDSGHASILWSGYANSLFGVLNYFQLTHDEAAADAICSSLKRVHAAGGLARDLQLKAGTRLDCIPSEPPRSAIKSRPSSDADLTLGESQLAQDARFQALTKEEQVAEIRRRIEARRARMHQEAEAPTQQ
jgi:hypothetical protein